MNGTIPDVESTEFVPYHHGTMGKREREWRDGTHTRKGTARAISRPFIFWDGEGVRNSRIDNRRPTSYALLGNSTGARLVSDNLSTRDCLRFIIRQGIEAGAAFHVGFAFDYDVNMILRDMSPMHFRKLRDNGFVHYAGYRIEHVPHKWFQVTDYGCEPNARVTVRIADIFGFFQCSFVKALKAYIPDDPLMERIEIIESGKDARNTFTYADIDYITEYWETEIELGLRLVSKLRDYLYDVDLKITRWHGPGALANYVYKRQGIQAHKNTSANAKNGEAAQIYRASRYAYAGGRFEQFLVGRIAGPVYGIDINSAYPFGISQLPSLTQGYWEYVALPESIEPFGVYRIAFTFPGLPKGKQLRTVGPSPLFHRDKNGEVSFQWRTDGWYWSPEAKIVADNFPDGPKILEGWVYRGWESQPFGFVRDMYDQRKLLKASGIGSEKALKLCLNSLYGKMAQRTGWQRTGKAPTWHQLEWAGWVTSNTRAMLWNVMWRIPRGKLIAVETDGIYTTESPDRLGISNSKDLGGWEISEYDEMLYLQSGTYFYRQGNAIGAKYRGLDPKSLQYDSAVDYLKRCGPVSDFPAIEGITTRFVGYRAALFREDQNRGPMKMHHCAWETDKKDISVGRQGKRIHYASRGCPACVAGKTAYEMAHEVHINGRAYSGDIKSYPHDIPWQDEDIALWRGMADESDDLLV